LHCFIYSFIGHHQNLWILYSEKSKHLSVVIYYPLFDFSLGLTAWRFYINKENISRVFFKFVEKNSVT
jgi:hypothetical protein